MLTQELRDKHAKSPAFDHARRPTQAEEFYALDCLTSAERVIPEMDLEVERVLDNVPQAMDPENILPRIKRHLHTLHTMWSRYALFSHKLMQDRNRWNDAQTKLCGLERRCKQIITEREEEKKRRQQEANRRAAEASKRWEAEKAAEQEKKDAKLLKIWRIHKIVWAVLLLAIGILVGMHSRVYAFLERLNTPDCPEGTLLFTCVMLLLICWTVCSGVYYDMHIRPIRKRQSQ